MKSSVLVGVSLIAGYVIGRQDVSSIFVAVVGAMTGLMLALAIFLSSAVFLLAQMKEKP